MRHFLWAGFLVCMLAGCGGASNEIQFSPDRSDEAVSESNAQADADDERVNVGGTVEIVVGEDICETDADCVPAACCHATACVAQDHAPTCNDALCTADCQGGTIDCGGGCLCQGGRCATRLWRMTPPPSSAQ